MKNKMFKFTIIIFIIIIIVLFLLGIIPKQIAKIYASNYMNNKFPEMKFEYIEIEWSEVHGDYLIYFKDKDNERYGCVIGPKYFPISLGQGLFAIEQKYLGDYSEPITIEQKIAQLTFAIDINAEEKTSYSEQDLTIDKNLFGRIVSIINSETVKKKVKEEYPNVNNIEIEKIEDSNLFKLIYVCENYSEKECIEIVNKYYEVFKENITNIYTINDIYIIDETTIDTRIIEK